MKRIIYYIVFYIITNLIFLGNHFYHIFHPEKEIFIQIERTFYIYAINPTAVVIITFIPIIIFSLLEFLRQFKKLNFRGTLATQFTITYIVLVIVTNAVGTYQIENHFCNKYEEIEEFKGRRYDFLGDEEIKIPWYNVDNYNSFIPFVSILDHGSVIEPLNGQGTTQYYFWFFGIHFEIFEFYWWFT